MDWVTASIMAMGVVILGVFIVIPLREFRQILRHLQHQPDPVDPERSNVSAKKQSDGGNV